MEGYEIFSSVLQPLFRESDMQSSVEGVLNNINTLFRVSSSSLSLHINSVPKPVDFTYHTGVDKEFTAYYNDKQKNIDPISDTSVKYALDTGFTMGALCNQHPNWSNYYKSSFLSFGYMDALLVNFYSKKMDRGVLVLRSSPHRGEFKVEEAHSISRLSPYLRIALNTHLQFYNQGLHSAGEFNTLSNSEIAVMHLSKTGQLLQANTEGYNILSIEDGLSIRNNHIYFNDSVSHFHFKQALADISNMPVQTSKTIKIQRDQEHFFVARISLINTRPSQNNEITLIICDPFSAIRNESTNLCELFNLTYREASVAVYLGNGYKLSDIAIQNGVSINTLKSQRNSIYEKIGIKNQIQLVRLIYSLRMLSETGAHTVDEDTCLQTSVKDSLYSGAK